MSDVPQPVVAPASYKVIYAYSDTHPEHVGRLKVGDTTLTTSKKLEDITLQDLQAAAHARIDAYTKTADIAYTLEHVELALKPVFVYDTNGNRIETDKKETFRDYAVHEVFMRSDLKKTFVRSDKTNGEWFEVTVDQVKQAVWEVKNGGFYLSRDAASIKLRPEQEAAVKQSLRCFRGSTVDNPKRMLWNAKMRFGKTLTTYKLIEELAQNDDSFKRVLILTHRPDVNDGWSEDFQKMGMQEQGWVYGSKKNLLTWDEVKQADKLVWFASIQDLRGSDRSGSLDEAIFKASNRELFETDFQLVVTDEAHEGTLTQLAKNMFAAIKSKNYLDLSGTPFNIIEAEDWEDEDLARRFAYDDVYHWSYLDERRAKREWDEVHGEDGEPNPYAYLPEVKFITYDIADALDSISDETLEHSQGDISFTELFRTEKSGEGKLKFVHEEQVQDLLFKLLAARKYSDDTALFPFHRDFKNYFNHTLWMLPNVAACSAMETLLKQSDSGFNAYRVINATGMGGESWENNKNALSAVRDAIATSPKTITLSQQMLTTGVTVTGWTAVFMMNNTTSPMLYMQAAFRAASPGCLPDGRLKEYAYVFDFHPDRCLGKIVEVAKANAKIDPHDDPVQQDVYNKEAVTEYLEYISVLTLQGAKFVKPDSDAIMEQLNEAYVNEVVDKGFDSPRLWNNQQLQNFDINRVSLLESLRKLTGAPPKNKCHLSQMEEEDREKLARYEKSKHDDASPPLTPEEAAEYDALKQKEEAVARQEKKNRQNAISVLAGIAARLPMLVYAAPADERITPQNFATLIDDESWELFMPKNLLRVMPEGTKPFEERQEEALGDEGNVLYWDDVRRFFDATIFSLACERVRSIARDNDTKPPLERAFRTAALFSTFKNPDKETVLTPYRVVELQYTSTLGGLSFLDLEASTSSVNVARTRNVATGELESHPVKTVLTLLEAGTHELAPVWIAGEGDDLSKFWQDAETTVLDINSKTALYPLFAAVSLFYQRCGRSPATLPPSTQDLIWKTVVEQQVFANCRVPYAELIARRVLAGYNDYAVNTSVVDVLSVRSKLKEVRLPKDEGKKGTRPLTDEEEALLWRSLFNPRAMQSKTTEELVKELLMTDDEKIEALLKQLEGEQSDGFAACVSNPPYQIETAQKDTLGQKTVTNVFQFFQEVADVVSEKASMIYPGERWVHQAGKGMKEFGLAQLNSRSLQKVIFFPDKSNPFSTAVGIQGGVTIVFKDTLRDNQGAWTLISYEETQELNSEIPLPGESLISLNPRMNTLLAKVGKQSSRKTLDRANLLQKLFCLESSFIEENPGLATPCNRDFSNAPTASSVRVLTNDRAGKAGRAQWYWIDRENIPAAHDLIPKWKVVISSVNTTGINGRSPAAELLPPNTAFGRARLGLAFFESEEEAKNFLKWLATDFVRTLVASSGDLLSAWGKNVPAPEDFLTSGNSGLNFSESQKNLNDQLCELYGLSEEDKLFMRDYVANNLAPLTKSGK